MTGGDRAGDHDDHGGLDRDMPVLLNRRHALLWLGGTSLAGLLAACGASSGPTTSAAPAAPTVTTASPPPTAATAATTGAGPATTSPAAPPATALAELIGAEIPDEAAGPFPADGTNGPNVLADDGPLKADLTTSFGALAGTAAGVPTTLRLAVVDNEAGAPLPGAVVYLWHCTADGRYSIYEIPDQNYLRGVQVADEGGRVAFETIFPGCYPGRWPHCHFEVFRSLDEATTGATAIKTSQLAFSQADCETVFADSRYGPSAANLARLSLATDVVFRDGWADQLATVAGSVADGYTASLLVRV